MTEGEKPFQEMTEEEREAFLAERKEESAKKYKRIKAKHQAQKEKYQRQKDIVHQGNRFIYESKQKHHTITMDAFSLREFLFTSGALKLEEKNGWVTCRIAFAIKSPTDKRNDNTGRGLVGYRLKYKTEYGTEIRVPAHVWYLDKAGIRALMRQIIATKLATASEEIPWRVINSLYGPMIRKWSRVARSLEPIPPEPDETLKVESFSRT